jgi:hypothetical protein
VVADNHIIHVHQWADRIFGEEQLRLVTHKADILVTDTKVMHHQVLADQVVILQDIAEQMAETAW